MKGGWTYKKLGDVCCKSSNIKWDDVSNDASYKYIDLTSVYRTDLRIHDPQIITKENAPSRAKQIVKVGDVIFATTRPTLRRVSLIDDKHDGALCSTGFCVLRPNTEISSKWIFYCLQNNGFYNYIEPLQTGASYPAVTDGIVKGYVIPVPPLDEQKRIVERLDAAFENIDKLKANAEKQLAEAQTLFQKSLAKAMEPNEGWEEKKLGDVAAIFSGYAFKSSVFQKEGKYQVLRIGNIKQNNLRLSDNAVFMDDLDSGVLNKSLLKEGDLVVTQTGTRHKRDYGFVAMVEKDNLLLNQRNACVRFRNKMSAQFFLYYSYTDLYKESFFANEGGTVGQGNVGLSALKEMKYYTPPLAEQQRIVERLDALSENIRKYEEIQRQIISECDALKQALLRKVFE